ncbi:MAG: glycosyltransferase family 4 protein [Thermoanaerobaculia bacterium]
MTRVLICGVAPLPFENTQKNYGPGIRSWQFARSLAAAGHQVRLLAVTLDDAYVSPPVALEVVDGVEIERLSSGLFVNFDRIRAHFANFEPECVVGATVYGSYALAIAQPTVPFWADQFGHLMAEAQAKAAIDGNDSVVLYFWKLLEPVLRWADHLSVVSEHQKWAAIGELGAVGRLSFRTIGHEFAHVVPCALPPAAAGEAARVSHRRESPEQPFQTLWSGSYNTWSDVRTLVEGLEIAMGRNPTVRFVSTGGEIPGHDESTYRELVERVAHSPFSDRFELRGWLIADELPAILAASDLGILTEKPIYEGMMGSKNRVVQWMGSGLAVAYNNIGDLGALLDRQRLGLTFPVGDSEALADRICWAAEHPEELAALADAAQRYALENLTFSATTRELVAWVDRPTFAPDNGFKPTVPVVSAPAV